MFSRFPQIRVMLLAAMVLVALFALVLVVSADSIAVDFETYTVGTVDEQDGWQSDGAAGFGHPFDHFVVTNTYGYATFGTKSLRMSNAVVSGSYGDQTFSKSTVDEAGETTATNGGKSGGTRQEMFVAEWQFASTVPGAEQPGLSVVASPDRGDGARMSWVQMADTPTGLAVRFNDFSSPTPDVCVDGAFNLIEIASSLDRTVPHTIRIEMEFYDGQANDIVRVYVDGALAYTGTSWEDYFVCFEPGATSRTVDSIMFRTGGTPGTHDAPATLGYGFLIDNLTVTTGPAPTYIYISPNMKNGVVDGVPFNDQDILVNEIGTSDWEMFFDGSTFGITKNLTDFTFDGTGCLLMTFNGNQKLGGTIYKPQDVAQFCPTVPGDYTAGTFSMYLDGSDVGLTTGAEIIDALEILPDGRLVISPKGNAKVPENASASILAQKNDLLVFNYTAYGPATTGYWSMYLDNVLVPDMNKENIISSYIDNGDKYMTFWTTFTVGDETGDYNDVVVIHPDYSADVFWDGDAYGYHGRIHGLHIK